jgi:hypothetical protein
MICDPKKPSAFWIYGLIALVIVTLSILGYQSKRAPASPTAQPTAPMHDQK